MKNAKKENDRARRPLIVVLYVLGLLMMLVVAGLTIWPEIELVFFDRPLIIEEAFPALHCPPAVTRAEDGTIAATFTNDSDREQRFRAQARFSYLSPAVYDDFDQWVELAPGETETVRWALDTESAAFGRVILARVHVQRRGSISPQEAGCGMVVLDLPFFSGALYVYALVIGAFLSLAASAFLWLDGRPPAQAWRVPVFRRRVVLAVVVAGAMLAGLTKVWVLGGLLLLLSLLLLISFSES